MSSKAETILNHGQYKIERVLGRGEYGITYRATDIRHKQVVAIKTVNPSLRHHTEFAQFQHHFKAVARHLSQCSHPNLVKVLDVFEDRGLPFMVMNYIPSQPVLESLALSSQLPVTQAVKVIRQVASALGEIHQQGIIHCNLTPEVILRNPQTEQIILTDFGVASRLTDAIAQPYLGSRILSGGYTALEQYLPHEQITIATDIYSLAAILYRLLAGKPPLEAPLCLSEVTEAVLSPSKPNLRQLRPDLSPTLERVILWGLELEQQHRPQSLKQWLAFLPQLEDYAVVEPIVSEEKLNQGKTSSTGSSTSNRDTETTSFQDLNPKPLTAVARFSSIPGLVPLLFVMTSMFSGCVGFYLTRVYGGVNLAGAMIQPEASFNQQFPNYDPSKPVFQETSGMMAAEDERDFDYIDPDELNGNESQPYMASEERWTEEYASNDWDSEPTNYETVDSLPSSIDGYYSESQLTTDDPYSSEYSSEERYPSSPASEYPDYSTPDYSTPDSTSTPASYSDDYSSPETSDSSSYSSEYSWDEPDPTDEPSLVNSDDDYSADDPVSGEPYNSVDTYSDIKPELPTSSQPKWGSEYNPSSLDSDLNSETEIDYEIPSDRYPLSVPKFETQS
ncbi:MAG: serine/threonine-protein kinase [Cyanobacteria bacterium J06592_8]